MLKIVNNNPEPKKPRAKRKGPDEWRSIARAAKVKDGRPLLLIFPNDERPKSPRQEPCYWHAKTGKWWLVNTAPGHGDDAASDLFGDPVCWRPYPGIPDITAFVQKTPAVMHQKAPRETNKMQQSESIKKTSISRLFNGFNRNPKASRQAAGAH